jgi:uncharacterized protein (TIGR02001 family)
MQASARIKQSLIAVTLGTLFAGTALAQTPAPAAPPPPDNTVTANVGLFSEYIFRGISQTAGKPAVQGGFDWAHSSGFYAGTWASNISWLEDFGLYNRSSLEWDFYGGYKANFPNSDFFYDVGTIYYYYPGKRNPGVLNADTWELYGALGWQWISLKASWTVSDNYFGIQPNGQKTDGTVYIDLTGTYPVGETGFSLVGHVGYLDVHHDGSGNSEASYTDWKAGVAYVVPDGVLKGVEFGAYYTGNNAKEPFYTDQTGYDTSKDRGVVYVKKTF